MPRRIEDIGATERRLFPRPRFWEHPTTVWHPRHFGRTHQADLWPHQKLARHIGEQMTDSVMRAIEQIRTYHLPPEMYAELRAQVDPRLVACTGKYAWAKELEDWKGLNVPGVYDKLCEAVCESTNTIFTTQTGATFRGQWLSFISGREALATLDFRHLLRYPVRTLNSWQRNIPLFTRPDSLALYQRALGRLCSPGESTFFPQDFLLEGYEVGVDWAAEKS